MCNVAIVDCIGSATASFKDLVTVAQKNSTNQPNSKWMLGRVSATAFGLDNSIPGVSTPPTNQTASGCLVEYQLQPLELAIVFQE